MNTEFRVVEGFPEPEFSALQVEVFSGLEQKSRQLADVLAVEAKARTGLSSPSPASQPLRIGAYLDNELIGWTYGWVERERHFYMSHSGVVPRARGKGIYSELVRRVLEYCKTQGHVAVESRHIVMNNPVIIAKLKLGFFVSGYSYSEIYGPLVHLKHILGEERRELLRGRAAPLRPAGAHDA